MAHNYSTPDPLRLPSIRSLEIGVYSASNTNNNSNGSTPVDYVQQQQQQQQQYPSQSQVRYSEEYYSHNNSREMGYYGHDPSNAQTAAATTTTTSTLTSGPSISQAHSHNNPSSAAGSGPNVSPYRRPRTISSNLSNQIDNNAKYRDPHIHHSSSSNNSGSSSSIHSANSGSLGTPGAAGGAPATATAAASSQTIGNPNQRSSSSSYPASTYSGHLAYSDYYSQRGGGGSGGASAAATVSPTTTTATTTAANPTGWYYASHTSQNSPSQSASPPVVAQQQKPQPQQPQQQYSHAASPLQSPVSVPSQQPQQQQQQQYYSQAESMSPYSQQQQQQGSMQSQRTPRSQPMHPPSSSLHPSGGLYPGTNSGATSHRGHSHHMAVPSINTSSSSLAGGNGSTSTAVPASSAAPTSTNVLIHNLEEDASRAAAEGAHLAKIIEHCQAISKFADHYASQNTNSNATPSPTTTTSSGIGGSAVPGPTSPEYTEMATRADIVLKLVYQLRKEAGIAFGVPGFSGSTASSAAGIGSMMTDEAYKKKRSWDDDDSMGVNGEVDALAHQDMALIRSKRAQGGGTGNVPGNSLKSKYKKRSRACPPGKCHSCNTRETPEWRRGPDGARTLCNACGLHYAKLIRKRDKNPGAVDLTPISVEMLRASTRADSAKHLADIGGSIALSGVGLGSGVPSGNSGGGSGGSTTTGSSGSSASVGPGSSTAGAGTTGSSDMAEITLQPVGGTPSSASTGVTLSPITGNNGSLTGPGRSVSNSSGGGSGGGGSGGGGMPVHWISPTQHVYRYTGPDSTSSASGNHGNNGAGSSYHSHSHSSHSSHSTHSHSSGTHSYTLPPPPHHHTLHLPHPLQRGSNNGYSDGYPASLTRSSASVGGGDGRGSPDI